MALIDRRIAPGAGDIAALVAFARRCPDCPAFGVEDLALMSGRAAFTWRLSVDQALTLDETMLRLRRQLGRAKLDRAEMLAALVGLADAQPWVFDLLVLQMQDTLGDARTRDR
jgi:hypothetical protein